jgi:hypothetical protein
VALSEVRGGRQQPAVPLRLFIPRVRLQGAVVTPLPLLRLAGRRQQIGVVVVAVLAVAIQLPGLAKSSPRFLEPQFLPMRRASVMRRVILTMRASQDLACRQAAVPAIRTRAMAWTVVERIQPDRDLEGGATVGMYGYGSPLQESENNYPANSGVTLGQSWARRMMPRSRDSRTSTPHRFRSDHSPGWGNGNNLAKPCRSAANIRRGCELTEYDGQWIDEDRWERANDLHL